MTERKDRLRVLIVEDSAFMRKVLHDIIAADPEMEIVGEARDGREGEMCIRDRHLPASAPRRPHRCVRRIHGHRADGDFKRSSPQGPRRGLPAR